MIDLLSQLWCQLNNREIVSIFWIVLFLCYLTIKTTLFKSFLDIIKALKPLLLFFVVQSLYLGMCFYLITVLGYWEVSLLKDSIITIFTLSFLCLSVKPEEVVKNKKFFWKFILNNLTIIGVFELIISTFTFPIYVEFFLVPIIAVASIFKIYAKSGSVVGSEKLLKILNVIIYFLGFIVLFGAFWQLIQNYTEFFKLSNLKSYFLSLVASFLFLPFLYVLQLYSLYETYLTKWKHICRKSPITYEKLRLTAFISCNFNIYKLFNFQERNRLKILELYANQDVINRII